MEEKKPTNYYVDPDELHNELVKWKQTGEMSELLGKFFIQIAEGMSYNMKFINYSSNWKEEMVGKAIIYLCKYADNYNPEHENANAFAYCSKIVYRAFIQYIQNAKKDVQLKKDISEFIQHLNSESIMRLQQNSDE